MYRPPPLAVTATQRTNTIETIARLMVFEGGISILEEAMTLAANQLRQATVGRDLPSGAQNCTRLMSGESLRRKLKTCDGEDSEDSGQT